MKAVFYLIICSFLLAGAQEDANIVNRKLYGTFDGRTPCRELADQLSQSGGPECIKIKWRLRLHVDSISNHPAGYELTSSVFKRDKPQTGNWKILRGTFKDPDAMVYELQITDKPSLYFQCADNNILFFLTPDKKLRVGNRDFSYTLNRVVH